MKYLVEATVSIERGSAIDNKGGPESVIEYIAQRFKPEAMYGNPPRRPVFIIVDSATGAEIAELMFILTRAAGAEPKFTPLMPAEAFSPAIEKAKKAPNL